MLQKRLSTDQALAALESALSQVDHAERTTLGAGERVRLMQRARRVAERVSALADVLTDEVNRDQASMKAAGTPLTSFLAVDEQLESRRAAAEVFRARDVAARPAVRDAALNGQVSGEQAAAISKAMAQLPADLGAEAVSRAEELLLERAASTTARRLASMAPEVLAAVAPEQVPGPDQHAAAVEAQARRARARRNFTWGDDGDGSVWFRGSLPAVDAAPLVAALEAYVAADRRESRDRLTGMRATRPGPRLLRDHATADLGRTPEQRRADAVVQLMTEHRGAPTAAGDRPRIVVVMQEADLRSRAEAVGVLGSGQEIAPGDLRRLCCDADLTPVVLGSASEILDVGRTERLVTPGIRKAMSLRDKGCVFPHCNVPDAQCGAHHVVPWHEGGDTSLGNLASLCDHHHAVVEPQRFNPDADQWTITFHPVTRKPVVSPPRRMRVFLRPPGSTGAEPPPGATPDGPAEDAGG